LVFNDGVVLLEIVIGQCFGAPWRRARVHGRFGTPAIPEHARLASSARQPET
jgi:hypothetical protein